MDEREKTSDLRAMLSDRAIEHANAANEKRFESVNEFRNTLADQAKTLMPRQEAEARMHNQDEKIASLFDTRLSSVSSSSGMRSLWGYIVGGLGAALFIIDLILRSGGK